MHSSNRKKLALLTAAVGMTAAVFAQRGYGYMRPLENVPAGWNQLTITGDMFTHLNNDVSDIRIWHITGKDTTEVPYVLQISPLDTVVSTVHNKKNLRIFSPVNNYKTRYTVEQTPDRATVIHLEIPEKAPVNTVALFFGDTLDYRRSMEITSRFPRYSSRNVNQEYYYRTLVSSEVASKQENVFELSPQVLLHMQITIFNNDNAPLKIDSIKVSGPLYRIMGRFPAGGKYVLAYGNKKAVTPSYDIVNFSIPSKAHEIYAGAESVIPQPPAPVKKKSSPLFENKLWLYGLMGLLVLVLGGFTLGMMRSKEKE